MRKFLLLSLVCLLLVTGCAKKKSAAQPSGPLVPTARENAVLRSYGLVAESAQGQRKIHELRFMNKKIDEARTSAAEWAKHSSRSRDADQ